MHGETVYLFSQQGARAGLQFCWIWIFTHTVEDADLGLMSYQEVWGLGGQGHNLDNPKCSVNSVGTSQISSLRFLASFTYQILIKSIDI